MHGMTRHEVLERIKWRLTTIHLPLLTKSLLLLGAFSFMAGLLSLFSAFSLLTNGSFSDPANSMITNGTFGILHGAISVISSRVLIQGRLLGIWLLLGNMLMDYSYKITIGEKLNYFFVGLSLFFIWRLLNSRKGWDLH